MLKSIFFFNLIILFKFKTFFILKNLFSQKLFWAWYFLGPETFWGWYFLGADTLLARELSRLGNLLAPEFLSSDILRFLFFVVVLRLKENPKGSKAFDANNDSGYKNAVKMTLLQKIFHEKIKKKLKIWVLIKKIDY